MTNLICAERGPSTEEIKSKAACCVFFSSGGFEGTSFGLGLQHQHSINMHQVIYSFSAHFLFPSTLSYPFIELMWELSWCRTSSFLCSWDLSSSKWAVLSRPASSASLSSISGITSLKKISLEVNSHKHVQYLRCFKNRNTSVQLLSESCYLFLKLMVCLINNLCGNDIETVFGIEFG